MILSNSHCHLDRHRTEFLEQALEQASTKRVDIILSMGMDLNSSADTVQIAKHYDAVLAAIGIHPRNAIAPNKKVCQRLYELATSQHVVAIGEIGLDYRPDYAPDSEARRVQKELFIYQLSLAKELGFLKKPQDFPDFYSPFHCDRLGMIK